MGTEFFGNNGPTHEFGNGEEFQELLFERDEGVAGIGIDALEEVGLFVIVGGEDYIVNNSLENLRIVY